MYIHNKVGKDEAGKRGFSIFHQCFTDEDFFLLFYCESKIILGLLHSILIIFGPIFAFTYIFVATYYVSRSFPM